MTELIPDSTSLDFKRKVSYPCNWEVLSSTFIGKRLGRMVYKRIAGVIQCFEET